MATVQERKKRGGETIKQYRSVSGGDAYACAADAIADILLFVAQNPDEGTQLLQCAEMDFRCLIEVENLFSEG